MGVVQEVGAQEVGRVLEQRSPRVKSLQVKGTHLAAVLAFKWITFLPYFVGDGVFASSNGSVGTSRGRGRGRGSKKSVSDNSFASISFLPAVLHVPLDVPYILLTVGTSY